MIGLTIVAICVILLVTIFIIVFVQEVADRVVEYYPRWVAQRRGIPEADYQPLNTGTAWREPLEFEATRACPHCGKFDTHSMNEPDRDTFNFKRNRHDNKWQHVAYHPSVYEKKIARSLGDRPDCATVRRCAYCSHAWGEK